MKYCSYFDIITSPKHLECSNDQEEDTHTHTHTLNTDTRACIAQVILIDIPLPAASFGHFTRHGEYCSIFIMASFANGSSSAAQQVVSTPYGPGRLISKRPDNVNVIELDWELANNSKAVLYKSVGPEVVDTPMGKGILKQRRPDGVDVIELGWELANNSKAIVYKEGPWVSCNRRYNV